MKINGAREVVTLLNLPLDIEEKLKKESIIKTVHYSTKIEGNGLNLDEVYDALENKRHSDQKDIQEVRNYYKALIFLEKKVDKNAKVTEDFIRELHSIIEIQHTGRKALKTPYREGQNVIKDSMSGDIVYMPPEYSDVPVLMRELVQWIEEKDNQDIPTPIKAAIAAYQLVTIHPFWDGNGRTARALATYILKKGEYDLKGFYSMEEFYDKDIARYYDSLQMSLHHNYYFGRNDADLTQWITYFLEVMVEVFEKVSKRVEALYKENSPQGIADNIIDKRQRWIINTINQKGFINSKDVADRFKIDTKTARIWLKGWVDDNFLQLRDPLKQRNVEYILSDKFINKISISD